MISSLSIAARRSAMMASRRISPFASPSVSALSTQAEANVQTVEDLLTNMRWAYLKDNVEEIRLLLNEPKTNHSLRKDAVLEDEVSNQMKEIQDLLVGAPNQTEVESRVTGLKKQVKSQLYSL